ncbi:MAG: DUF4905 domain-containing protein, partial [Ignavibacteriae bacterium]
MLILDMASVIPFFKEKQLTPAWSFDAGSLIWRIYFTSNNLIIGEARSQETKTTNFFCLDVRTGNPLWSNVGFDEPWWIGIETVYQRWMILHGFVRPDIPEHRGIRVVDIGSGGLLWRNDELSYWFMDGEKLYAHKYLFEKHVAYELDINSGAVINEYADDLDRILEIRNTLSGGDASPLQDVLYPEVLDAQEERSPLGSVIQRITKGRAL